MRAAVARLTLAQAACLPFLAWDGSDGGPGLKVQDLEITGAERARLAALWLWLVGVAPDSLAAASAGNEVLTDGPLLVALSLPAAEFLSWWRCQAWAEFDSTARTGSEAWAWDVMDRVRAACLEMGALAVQVPIRAPG